MSGKSHQAFAIRSSMMALLVVGMLAACYPPTPASEPDQVTLQLSWYHEAEFSGYYVAEAKGFYADENIEVTIHEWDFDKVWKRPGNFALMSSCSTWRCRG